MNKKVFTPGRLGTYWLAQIEALGAGFGGWHKAALAALTRLGRQLARTLGSEERVQVRHFRQRVGVLLARDNVAMICSRCPTFPEAEIDGEED